METLRKQLSLTASSMIGLKLLRIGDFEFGSHNFLRMVYRRCDSSEIDLT